MLTTKERPILYSGPMIRAKLAGLKTQTRRVVNPQPHGGVRYLPFVIGRDQGRWEDGHGMRLNQPPAPGDRLWAREAFRFPAAFDDRSPRAIKNGFGHVDGLAPIEDLMCVKYEAGGSNLAKKELPVAWGRLRPSIHMPRWAARIITEVVSVRCERLQDITEDEALAEGVGIFGNASKWSALGALAGILMSNPQVSRRGLLAGILSACDLALEADGKANACTARGAFAHLWDSINADRGFPWESNPWVWVIEDQPLAQPTVHGSRLTVHGSRLTPEDPA